MFNYKILKKTRRYYHKNTFAYLMPHEKSVDIDNKLDFEIAAKLFKKNNECIGFRSRKHWFGK